MAKVSLIIPTFSRPHLLPRCVDSAHKAGSSVEVIVVDDASSDETASVCQKLRDIKYVRLDSNRGVAGARNEGVGASTGEYIGFLDDDDLRLPNSIDAQVNLLEAHPKQEWFTVARFTATSNAARKVAAYPDECPQGDIFWQLMQWNFIPCLTVIFRRACLDRVGLLDESATGVDDWDLWVRISELYPVLATERRSRFGGSRRQHRDSFLSEQTGCIVAHTGCTETSGFDSLARWKPRGNPQPGFTSFRRSRHSTNDFGGCVENESWTRD